jgi:hypothetical protein
LEAVCAARGGSDNIFQRARQRANIEVTKLGFQGKWMCHLPGRLGDPELDKVMRELNFPEPVV